MFGSTVPELDTGANDSPGALDIGPTWMLGEVDSMDWVGADDFHRNPVFADAVHSATSTYHLLTATLQGQQTRSKIQACWRARQWMRWI